MGQLSLRDQKQLDDLRAMREASPIGRLRIIQCRRCLGGQVIAGQCIQCGAEHDKNGRLSEPPQWLTPKINTHLKPQKGDYMRKHDCLQYLVSDTPSGSHCDICKKKFIATLRGWHPLPRRKGGLK